MHLLLSQERAAGDQSTERLSPNTGFTIRVTHSTRLVVVVVETIQTCDSSHQHQHRISCRIDNFPMSVSARARARFSFELYYYCPRTYFAQMERVVHTCARSRKKLTCPYTAGGSPAEGCLSVRTSFKRPNRPFQDASNDGFSFAHRARFPFDLAQRAGSAARFVRCGHANNFRTMRARQLM